MTKASSTRLFQVAKTFDIKASKGVVIEGFADESNPFIPPKEAEYVFRKDHLRDVLAFLSRPRTDGLFLTGPTGAGKTSLIRQVAARLNWPVQEVNCHGRMEFGDLLGHWTMVNGTMEFLYGPLATAMREGHILVLNEIDFAEPQELAGLNTVLDGAPLVIPQKGGEVILPNAKFRLVATGNSRGQGDQTGLHSGVLQQNIAFMDRFRVIEVGYMEAGEEEDLLARVAGAVTEDIRKMMVAVANEIRRLFLGDNDNPGELSLTMSTRSLVRWASLTLDYKSAPRPLEYALERALLMRADREEREAILRVAKDKFGELWDGIVSSDPVTKVRAVPAMRADNVMLLRKDNGNGTSKDWAAAAVAEAEGTILTVWFGRSGRPLQMRTVPPTRWSQARMTDEIRNRYQQKEREGYVPVGNCAIEDDGTVRMNGAGSSDNPRAAVKLGTEAEQILYFEIQRKRGRVDVVHEFMQLVRQLAPKVGGILQGDGVSFTLTIGSWSVALDPRLKVAGAVKLEHGVAPFLFLLALKKSAPQGVEVNVARDDGIEVSSRLLSEKDVLSWFGKTMEETASLAEQLGLITSIIDKAKAADQPDFYF